MRFLKLSSSNYSITVYMTIETPAPRPSFPPDPRAFSRYTADRKVRKDPTASDHEIIEVKQNSLRTSRLLAGYADNIPGTVEGA